MSSKLAFENIKKNAEKAEKTVIELKNELNTLTTQYNNLLTQQLLEENKQLSLAVSEAKKKLIELEVSNGVRQISTTKQPSTENPVVAKPITLFPDFTTKKKEKKTKETKEKQTQSVEPVVDFRRLDLRIGKIEDVQKHPDADTLYVLKINCGETSTRTVCSGLVKYIPLEALQGRDVVVLCNLKRVKMRGITSEAMVMCASSPDNVEVLSTPEGCVPGETVHCEGYERNPDPVLNPKQKIFETIAKDLATNGELQACYKGAPLKVPGKGAILAATLKNCAVK